MWNMFKLTIKAPEQPQWRRSGVYILNFEHFWHIFLDFEQVNIIAIMRRFSTQVLINIKN